MEKEWLNLLMETSSMAILDKILSKDRVQSTKMMVISFRVYGVTTCLSIIDIYILSL